MSRSRQHNPISGTCSYKAGTMKAWRRFGNRALRQAVRRAVERCAEVLPDLREIVNPWNSPSDGRMRFDPEQHPRLMRK